MEGSSRGLASRLSDALDVRQASHRLRRLTPREAGEDALRDFSRNDYLRLSQHPEVIEAAREAVSVWGASATASPLVSGYTMLHQQLEASLARWTGFAHALVWASGFAANRAVLSLLPQRGDIIFADRLIHHSMVSGILDSGARFMRFPHGDFDQLEALLESNQQRDGLTFVVTESVYSMDGDAPCLMRLAELKRRYGFVWVLDEAHALGCYGQRGSGLAEASGVTESVDVFVGTLGKSLGAQGAFTAFHNARMREFFVNLSGDFIYSTYLAPAAAAAALKAREVIERDSAPRDSLRQFSAWARALLTSKGFDVPAGDSPILPVLIGDDARVMRLASSLREKGWRVGAIRPPTVPEGTARLRLSVYAGCSQALFEAFATDLASLRQA